MTKRDMVVRISDDTGMIQADVLEVVQRMLDGLSEALAQGETIEIRNFGVFEVVMRNPRVGRNPHKPENEVMIPVRAVVKFRTGRDLKKKVLKLSQSLEGVEVSKVRDEG